MSNDVKHTAPRLLSASELDAVAGGIQARYYIVGGKIICLGCTDTPPKGAVPYTGPTR